MTNWTKLGPMISREVAANKKKKLAKGRAIARNRKQSLSAPIKKEPPKGLRRIPDDELNDELPF